MRTSVVGSKTLAFFSLAISQGLQLLKDIFLEGEYRRAEGLVEFQGYIGEPLKYSGCLDSE